MNDTSSTAPGNGSDHQASNHESAIVAAANEATKGLNEQQRAAIERLTQLRADQAAECAVQSVEQAQWFALFAAANRADSLARELLASQTGDVCNDGLRRDAARLFSDAAANVRAAIPTGDLPAASEDGKAKPPPEAPAARAVAALALALAESDRSFSTDGGEVIAQRLAEAASRAALRARYGDPVPLGAQVQGYAMETLRPTIAKALKMFKEV